ncbi:MAG TPA: flagellar basal-body MS-ring/collar protein FliF [Eoetvoesiella sp.]|uniref:flagellar basal-body MS-ring/collar protein FliF n=1 Tax=Eoetvoesiella sp. TaxID=1966355 RepID=UPI002BA0B680|nr:flagellar basal-body MS-ring/collar protein FliF [Eoetvoesiella sp.]HWK59892.1 flagellar basal-body MS-ring/collar protein FliF [Eoetvoesiella sp.]
MSQQEALLARFPALSKLSSLPKPVLIGAGAALAAIVIVLALWSRSPDYGVLFSNLEDRDGGTIVAALTQMNVPYKLSESGSAILVPKDRVHEVRLQLAGQGLPRGSGVGFELMDNTRFGASQFTEQVTYQRALEGELASTIQAVHAVKSARVHLAIPRESLFVRDRQAPTASVLLTLQGGRTLSAGQVSAITWLVSSSVPNLSADNVSIIDQNGRLLTSPSGEAGVDGTQRSYINDVEQRTVQRILTLLTPLVGPGNVRAQASADVDFSQREQTSETYRPNQKPGEAAVRSEQTSSSEQSRTQPPEGIPGALTNQPPANATAPIVTAPARTAGRPGAANTRQAPAATPPAQTTQSSGNAGATQNTGPTSSQHNATINYEVDRTINHVKDPMGKLRRLSVAVVVNYMPSGDGKFVPLPEEELAKLQGLVKDAMGYSAERGDTVTVVNSPFSDNSAVNPPVWKDPEYQAIAMQLAQYLFIIIALYIVWIKIVKPLMRSVSQASAAKLAATAGLRDAEAAAAAAAAAAAKRASEISRYEDNLSVARDLAEKDPRAVAMVLRSWMEKHGK